MRVGMRAGVGVVATAGVRVVAKVGVLLGGRGGYYPHWPPNCLCAAATRDESTRLVAMAFAARGVGRCICISICREGARERDCNSWPLHRQLAITARLLVPINLAQAAATGCRLSPREVARVEAHGGGGQLSEGRKRVEGHVPARASLLL